MIDFYARRCRSCRRRAAVRQRCFRLARRALRAHRFGGCSPAHRGDALLSTRSDARRSTNGTTARLRPLGRELARAEQLPPPRPPAPKPPHPPSSCANVTRSRLAVCKNEKNEDNEDSEKAGSCHLPPGHFVRDYRDRARTSSTGKWRKRGHLTVWVRPRAARRSTNVCWTLRTQRTYQWH